MSRISLAQQLKQLEGDAPKSIDPESAYASLDGNDRPTREGDEGREHYVDVGPSRLRAAAGADTAQTLLTEKYGGQASSRMKIFDDDDDEEEMEEDAGGFEDDDEEDDGEEDDDDEDDDDEDDEEDDEEDDDDDEEVDEPAPSGRTLDPVGALRASRAKDVEKGSAIKRQKDLFDQLLTMRITFQKALGAAFQIPGEEPEDDPAGEVADKRTETLNSLAKLSDSLFTLRENIVLPGVESKKRKRSEDEDVSETSYWEKCAADSLSLVDAAHPHLVPILSKWSTKIQAATLQLGSKAAGGSKFMQSARGVTGVVDAIDASLAQRRDNLKPLFESEEDGYRALLREVIESRQGGGNVDLSHLRREKKKKREAERGGSKGRKLRYTVHDKAVNFVVPIPLDQAWHEEQVDELFASLFGGVGIKGALSDMGTSEGAGAVTDLGGLQVF